MDLITAEELRAEESEDPEKDLEDYVLELATDGAEYNPIPNEYVALLTGIKGAGKDLSLARICYRAMYHKYPVWTNIEFYPEELKKLGIPEAYHPKTIQVEWMLNFQKELQEGVIAISELDTWIIKMKANSNLNILIGSFIKQLRKRNVKVFGSLHYDDAIPNDIHKEVDLLIHCNDAFYTDWGKENQIPRGKLIYQTYYDFSGVFTGHRHSFIQSYYIAHAEKLWKIYNSYQTYDPFTGFQKVGFQGNEILLDVSGRDHNTILGLWKMEVISLVLMYPTETKAGLFNDGVNTWLLFNPRRAARVASKNNNYSQIAAELEAIRGMRTKPFVKARKDAWGPMQIQALPDMVPQLQQILGDPTQDDEVEDD